MLAILKSTALVHFSNLVYKRNGQEAGDDSAREREREGSSMSDGNDVCIQDVFWIKNDIVRVRECARVRVLVPV